MPEAKIEVQFHRIAFASAPFSIESIAALAAFSANQKKACVERGYTIKDVTVSKKNPSDSPIYLIKVKDGYIAAFEGDKDYHIPASDSDIEEIAGLIKSRQDAGVNLSILLKHKFGLTAMSISHATHTTGAGDYDAQKREKRKKK